MADYVSFQPNLPSFGSDYLAQGFAGALGLPNYFQNVDRQGELWKYAQEMQPLEKEGKQLANEQMGLTNKGLQYQLSEKQLTDLVNQSLLQDPDYVQMAVENNRLAAREAGAKSLETISTKNADTISQVATQLNEMPPELRQSFVSGNSWISKIFNPIQQQALVENPKQFIGMYKANAPWMRGMAEEELKGKNAARTAAIRTDVPKEPTPLQKAQQAVIDARASGDPVAIAKAEETYRILQLGKGDVNAAATLGRNTDAYTKAANLVKGNKYTVNGETMSGRRLQQKYPDIFDATVEQVMNPSKPSNSAPGGALKAKNGELFTVKQGPGK